MRLFLSAAGVIIKDNKILLCQRSSNEKRFPLYWACPAGTKKPDDENFEATAKREVEEEIGVIFNPIRFFKINCFEMEDMKFENHVFLGSIEGEIKLDPEEVNDCGWFTYKNAKKLNLAFSYSRLLDDLLEAKLLQ
ncbi:MAG: NUDIX hydrolase [Nanoarchaeota archaeon]|nr:NUDIX hydrolase [Nanoarchaeota archaeon]MBU1030870.1 NUDIX hydrolase [Nanoarchaeota archaeon]MBU1849753.1 NUDIX hydrolase [Nanoarchaeota archaeon]